MVFLKRFYAEGFKSFAKPVNLNFQKTMIGIVGPNGSGKSNIVDALKWAMGEQSIKSLRGKEKTNLIFAGSKDMNEADFALVELTFDNSSKILHYDTDEVKISRKLIRKTGESVFMINDEPARLRDIQEIFLDSGLTKGSLGIISQGTVNWFAEAKPEDRRHMFEEAAGIGRYTKQKEDTLNLLDKATANLERLDQYEGTLKREIKDLGKQAEKAAVFQAKKNELERLDVSLAVQDVLAYKDELSILENEQYSNQTKLSEMQITVDQNKELRDQSQLAYVHKDQEVSALSKAKEELMKDISDLGFKQASYKSNLENNLNSQNIEERKKAYEALIASDSAELNSFKNQLATSETNLKNFSDEYQRLSSESEKINAQYSEILLNFNNRTNEFKVLNDQLQSTNSGDRGVNTLLNSKDIISGIHSTVSNLIQVDERYEIAIQTALGKACNNIIVDSSDIAVRAINFLKKNNAGRATFLPLDTIKSKEIREDTLLIMNQLEGFIDVANNLIHYDPIYRNAIKSLLGNVAVADCIDNANHIARMTNHNYKIITLDGDVVFSGGALSGGQKQKLQSIFNLEKKVEKAQQALEEATTAFKDIKIKKEQNTAELRNKDVEIQTIRTTIGTLRTKITDTEAKVNRNKDAYESLIKKQVSPEQLSAEINEFEKKLITLKEQYAGLEQKYVAALETKTLAYDQFNKYSIQYDRSQKELTALSEIFNKKDRRVNWLNNELKAIYNRITLEYEMTVDAAIKQYSQPLEISTNEAKAIIGKLKGEISALGNINFEAVERLAEKEKELESIQSEHQEARDSVINLKNIIEDLDKRARADFSNVVNKVNETIPEIFKNLFGGGKCEIKYTDPQNILESGIDVIVQPLGKKISNLVLLSGGEKTLVALTVLFALLKSSLFPLVVLDEAEAALDQANVSMFAKLIQEFSNSTQFLVITHRTGTMKMCDVLYGTTMQVKGVTKVIKTNLDEIKSMLSHKEIAA